MDFDEKRYLDKYPDVARAVELGVFSSGLDHYLKYGKKEKRCDYIEPVTKYSKVWWKLSRISPYHESRGNFDEFNCLMDKVANKESVHVARYNDGEWTFMLQIEPHYSSFMHKNGHDKNESDAISSRLLEIIKRPPSYCIGIDSTTRALKGLIIPKRGEYKKIIEPIKNIIYGDVFNTATVWFGITALTNPLKKRHTITVGPSYMPRLGMSKHHIEVPDNNCWHQTEELQKQVDSIIKESLDKKPVVVYACSFLSKLFVDIFYNKYGDKISQLDIGSCIDPWCGVVSRPWHRELIDHYRIERKPDNPMPRLVNLEKNPSIVSGYTSTKTSGLS